MLACPWEQRRPRYDFIVVGSGYGGAITAARLATAKLHQTPSICILERGREWPIGTFPDTLPDVLQAARSDLNPLGLFELLNYQDISVVKGSGLGGTSLINANVAMMPDREVFERLAWPGSLTLDALWPFFERAQQVLGVTPHPRALSLKKVQALERRARQLGMAVSAPDIAVNFTVDGQNPYGVNQRPCTDCGDCVTGCNVGAKNTLYMNYLPMARNAGAEIFTQAKVQWIEKAPAGGWRIHGLHYDLSGESQAFTLHGGQIILAAGAINSTEILMRSETHGLPLSPALGTCFSANGDFFLAYNGNYENQVLGSGTRTNNPGAAHSPGPTIAGVVRYNGSLPLNRRFAVEDFAFPSAYVEAAKALFGALQGQDTITGAENARRLRILHDLDPTSPFNPDGALNHSLLYLVTGMDDASGTMIFEMPWFDSDGRGKLVWNDAGRRIASARIREELRRHARASGAGFLTNPAWRVFNLGHLVSVHPLGGCPMGDDYMGGAADQYGRVFARDGSVHEGLFVADGALVPEALSANPLLTISALAEYIAERKILEMQGHAYPERPRVVSFAAVDPDDVTLFQEADLDRFFRRSSSLGIEVMLNGASNLVIDLKARSIRDDQHWRGFLPAGHVLNQMSLELFAGFKKQFARSAGRYIGIASNAGGRVLTRSTLEEITVDRRTGDLDSGRYFLGRYVDPPWEGFYEVFKALNNDLVIARVYVGEYPHGIRLFTYSMARRYTFAMMTMDDHRRLFEAAEAPASEQLGDIWRMGVIADANRIGDLGYLHLAPKPDGRIESRFHALGLFEGLLTPRFLSDRFQLQDFEPNRNEIRQVDPDLLVGVYSTPLPAETTVPLTTDLPGILHVETGADGRRDLCCRYVLARAGSLEYSILQAFLDVHLPDGVGMSWNEEFYGWYFPGVSTSTPGREVDRRLAERFSASGKPHGAVSCSLRVRINVTDLNEFIDGVGHEARLAGTLAFAEFEGQVPSSLMAEESRSYLSYLRLNERTGEAVMRYHLEFRTPSGRQLVCDGWKYLERHERERSSGELLSDYVSLFCHIYENLPEKRCEIGTAALKFRTFEDQVAKGDMREHLHSLSVTGAENPSLQLIARLRLLAFTGRYLRMDYEEIRSCLLAQVQVTETGTRSEPKGPSASPELPRKEEAISRKGGAGIRVYLSYRREDASGYAILLYDRLSRQFGGEQILMDLDRTAAGESLEQAINQNVRSCDAVIAVIGKQWLARTEGGAPSSLEDPKDLVRLEIHAALEQKLRLIPVLVGGASMPTSEDLPAALASLARRQPLVLTEATFKDDVESLIAALTRMMAARNEASRA